MGGGELFEIAEAPDASLVFVLKIIKIPHHGGLSVSAGGHGSGGNACGFFEAEGEMCLAAHCGGKGEEEGEGGKGGGDGKARNLFLT